MCECVCRCVGVGECVGYVTGNAPHDNARAEHSVWRQTESNGEDEPRLTLRANGVGQTKVRDLLTYPSQRCTRSGSNRPCSRPSRLEGWCSRGPPHQGGTRELRPCG